MKTVTGENENKSICRHFPIDFGNDLDILILYSNEEKSS